MNNSAYYTSQDICFSIIKDLPKFSNINELKILEPSAGVGSFLPLLINYYHDVPKVIIDLIDIDKDTIKILQELVKTLNIPKNFKKQLTLILDDMKRLNIQHNDIKRDEILINNGKVYLCDFGWGSINNNHSCNIDIWHGYKPYGYRIDDGTLSRFKYLHNMNIDI